MPRVVVRASPEEFTFSGESSSLQVAPIVWYNARGQVAAFGTGAFPADLRRFDLFPAHGGNESGDSRFESLQQFLRYHLECVLRPPGTPWWRYALGRAPDIVFAEVRDFDGRLDGDPRDLLTRAARAAGARRVVFLEPAPQPEHPDRAG